jgi:deoxyribodipyrimidine photolyase-related protein
MASADQHIILILGDQLSLNLSSLREADKSRDVILMAEVMAEATYAAHHKKKFVFVFSAMRHFAERLRREGWSVDYVKLEDAGNTQDLKTEISRAQKRHGISSVVMTEPGEWRLKQLLGHVPMLEDQRFICSHGAFRLWAEGRKELRMEYFYRDMRRQTGLLMNGDKPEGGQWNFDAENRKPASGDLLMAKPVRFEPDKITQDCIAMTERIASHNFGAIHPFWFGVTHEQADAALDDFLQRALPHFGETQDAMLMGQAFLHHAVLAPYINIGLLDPLEVCRRVEAEYKKGRVPLASAEGFIRQIIGWREFIRGIYWLKMPEYRDVNALNATRPLPEFYWTGDTKMNCVSQVVKQTHDEAYAHHIQRLMVTGNFALIAGINPQQVHEWYLAVYADAFEWVELPNTIGMALHADGGLLGSKPYAASGNYINKMSNYCKSCAYDVKLRTGDKACPFNALYWDFIARHHQRFSRNARMANITRVYEKFDDAEKQRIAASAATFLGSIKPWQPNAS